ncbi:SusC/RagA family TonB-linked outer membrane protein [Fulvivirga lutea]|uniref:TonB-dependent receptor n=1 Tax=Fulvivirga lutea TaxID=2810512 RepID=A0A974WDT7_9BACT|nr:TonB-dependent receptor [Fulvivirga lutea]QSE96328.1 TonB-dependent receptor [Fulvivirga lutea]
MKRIAMLFSMCLCISISAIAQTKVSGKVTSFEDGEPLPGVSVVIKGTTSGTVTDIDGAYTIEAPNPESTLIFSFIGMVTEEITVGNQSVIDVQLVPDITQLSEVVVVGYGTQKRKDITSSISTVDNELIANVPANSSFDGALQGRTAGLNIATSSATPGARASVNIRGVTSFGASSQPLYVVDGIPLVASNNSALSSNIQPLNPLADINPNDIETISVLKDASAAAIYGSRGANGVIIITTKRGKAGKTKFNIGYNTSISKVNNIPELMSSKQWIEFMNAAAEFDGLGPNYWNSTLGDPNDPNLPTYNAYDEILRTAIAHNVDLSAQGGDEKTKFFFSGNYFDQEGIQLGQNFERISGRLNLDHSASEKLGISSNLYVSRTNHQRTIGENDEYGVVVNAQAWDPTAPLFEEDGSYSNPFDYNGWWALENPVYIANEYKNESETTRLFATISGTYEIIENLNFKSSWSVDINSLIDEGFVPIGSQQASVGSGIYATYSESSWLNENTLTYDFTLNNDHRFNLLAGYTLQESRAKFSDVSGTGFSDNRVQTISTAANRTGSSSVTSFGFESVIGRINYNYRDKYLINLTYRSDGSSRFGKDNRIGNFPSVSLGWRLSNENFFTPLANVFSDFKLRASYGTIGNAEIGNFRSQNIYSFDDSYNGSGGASASQLGNPTVSWESTTQLNLGLDFSLFDGKISLTADYFEKETTDLLFDQDIPGTTGFRDIISNEGEINNKGFEFSINANILRRGDFTWSANANFTHIENEVVDVINNGQVLSRNFVLLEGKPISQLYLIKFQGVDPFTGDAVFEDFNGDGIINLDDRQAVGSGIPTYFGGFNNTFTYKGLSLDVFFQFSGGNKIFNQSRHAYQNYGSLQSGLPYGNQSIESLNYWRQPGDITNIPRPSLAGPSDPDAQWQRFSTQYLEDGDFMRLKNVKLSYSLPKSIIEKAKLSNVEIYVQGRNLITWTDYLGFDPEVSTNTDSDEALNTSQGEDFGTLGQARSYSIGINIGL